MEVVFEELGRVAVDYDSRVVDGGLVGEQMVEAFGRSEHRHEPVGAVLPARRQKLVSLEALEKLG